MTNTTAETLREARVVPVIDLADPDDAPALAAALLAGGARIAEMTLRSPRSLEALRAMADAARELSADRDGPGLIVAAGTVLTPAEFDRAVDAGATVVVSPGSTGALRGHAAAAGVPFVPGVASASEVMAAWDDGFDVVKFFPAEASGGVPALRSILAPLARTGISVMPTGGITADRAADYLAIGAVCAVGGSWMVTPALLAERRWDEVSRLMRQAVTA